MKRRRSRGTLARNVLKRRGPRVRWLGDYSNLPRSGRIAGREDGYAIIKWDDGTVGRVPAGILSTPRWRVG